MRRTAAPGHMHTLLSLQSLRIPNVYVCWYGGLCDVHSTACKIDPSVRDVPSFARPSAPCSHTLAHASPHLARRRICALQLRVAVRNPRRCVVQERDGARDFDVHSEAHILEQGSARFMERGRGLLCTHTHLITCRGPDPTEALDRSCTCAEAGHSGQVWRKEEG